MFNMPKIQDIFLIFAIPCAVIVGLVLAFTGYGWDSLWFVFGIPVFAWVLGRIIQGG